MYTVEDKINNPSNLIIARVAPWNELDSREIRSIDIRLTLCIHTCAIRVLRNSFACPVEILSRFSSRNNIKISPTLIRINIYLILRETNLGWNRFNFEFRENPITKSHERRYRRYRVLIRHFLSHCLDF